MRYFVLSRTAVDKITINMARRAVPLQQLSFLLGIYCRPICI